MKKSKSSHKWLQAHEDDEFVKRAREEGYRSRASYKLLEINEKFQLLKPGLCVVDLGAAPGGWSQVAVKSVGSNGKVIALDILEMQPIDSVTFIQGDFTEDEPFEQLLSETAGRPIDLVISDMAPNLSGMKEIDQPRSAYLVALAIQLCDQVLCKNGNLVSKCFEGEGINEIRQAFRDRFQRVINFKPRASRGKSREIYVIGIGHRQQRTV
ncbi:MAG: RlmE family RNA methyltransferase [bacterium]|nr:RlmE family RNA methyltransferase [Gammaproteobacteria bacterium]HIL95423.1 RlmE family RNA methyltransferase [Pseudomonadales bacterium]